jgi:nucleolin
MSKLNKRE